ncbi:GntR family transcriptional regulator [Streptomyces rugosispiralis]|uniref:GntR family transcriptional regulator n=1 Tax=Streptomyces rugosispiralis TaxID=2967341 RepID=A0ABT1V5H5_9ACTN|nr:GntR family transcriptional regulator [Streptomyces rugosispiralis]MCQ8192638.1 GntR family transcriptional regulator [Streptomyces rugosispiralis]
MTAAAGEMGDGGERRRPITPLPRGAGTALWDAIRADLLDRIKRLEFAAGEQLPSEASLADGYGVNRMTVRRALAELARAGAVRTEHGVGSFVAPQPIRHRIDDGNISLLESMNSRGHAVRQEHQQVITHPDPAATGDQGVPGLAQLAGVGLSSPSELWTFPAFPGPLVEYRYKLLLDEVPWCRSFAVLPSQLVPEDWDRDKSVFNAVADAHDLQLRRDDRRFSALAADARDAALLDIAVGAPLLLLSGTNVDQHGRIVAYIVHRIRGDRAEYALHVPR